jgi:AbrB family looped-hinge helix DNA binding protein
MLKTIPVKIGKRHTMVIPAAWRKRFGFAEGGQLIAEATQEGVLLRPAATVAVRHYSLEEKAAFLLNNAVDATDYAEAVKAVRKLGLTPEKIKHRRP